MMVKSKLVQYIRESAREHKVPEDVALAFAYAESGIQNVLGDLDLYKRPGYMDAVRRMHPANPAVNEPKAWRSYGPFQLQARWFVRDNEHPRELGKLSKSVTRALAYIRKQLDASDGDDREARLRYVAGDPSRLSKRARSKILSKYDRALQKTRVILHERRYGPIIAAAAILGAVLLGGRRRV